MSRGYSYDIFIFVFAAHVIDAQQGAGFDDVVFMIFHQELNGGVQTRGWQWFYPPDGRHLKGGLLLYLPDTKFQVGRKSFYSAYYKRFLNAKLQLFAQALFAALRVLLGFGNFATMELNKAIKARIGIILLLSILTACSREPLIPAEPVMQDGVWTGCHQRDGGAGGSGQNAAEFAK